MSTNQSLRICRSLFPFSFLLFPCFAPTGIKEFWGSQLATIMEPLQGSGFSPTDAVIGLLVIKPYSLPLSSFAVQTGLHIPLFQEWGGAKQFFRQVYTTTGWGMICCFYDPVSTQVSLSRFGGIPLAYLLPY